MTDDVQIPGYKLIRKLGEGGMATVYLATQESLDREVALKVMAPVLAANPTFCEQFMKEGRITAKLTHPHLMTVHDIGMDRGVYYLASEFLPAGTLPPAPYEILESPRFADLLQEARRRYDYVILDTAPLVPVPDSRLIAKCVDGLLLVVGAHKAGAVIETVAKTLGHDVRQIPEDLHDAVIMSFEQNWRDERRRAAFGFHLPFGEGSHRWSVRPQPSYLH